MRLTVLGCSGSGPGPTSPASGYLLEAGRRAPRRSTWATARSARCNATSTRGRSTRVLFSHLHPDHCADFASLAVHRRYHPRPPYDPTARPAARARPGEAPTRFAAAYAAVGGRAGRDRPVRRVRLPPVSDGGQRRGRAACTVARAGRPPVRGVRACGSSTSGRSLVYSGDTGPCDGLVELARGADVLLCEATWPHVTRAWDEPPPRRAPVRPAGRRARRAAGASAGC